MFCREMFRSRTPSGSISRTLNRSVLPGPACQEMPILSEDEDATCRLWTDEGAGREAGTCDLGLVIKQEVTRNFMTFRQRVSPVAAAMWTGAEVLFPAEATTLTVYSVPGTREVNPDWGAAEPMIRVLRWNPELLSFRVT